MKLIPLATATAAAALIGGAALAQTPPADSPPADRPPADAVTPTQTSPSQAEPTPADQTAGAPASTDVTAPSAGANAQAASFTSMTVTNGPVPDTPENRAKYGQPMSHAGKRTPARGN